MTVYGTPTRICHRRPVDAIRCRHPTPHRRPSRRAIWIVRRLARRRRQVPSADCNSVSAIADSIETGKQHAFGDVRLIELGRAPPFQRRRDHDLVVEVAVVNQPIVICARGG